MPKKRKKSSTRDEPQSLIPTWLVWVIIIGATGLVFVALTFIGGNPAAAMRDTGRLLQFAGISVVVGSVIAGIVRRLVGGKPPKDEGEEDDEDEDE